MQAGGEPARQIAEFLHRAAAAGCCYGPQSGAKALKALLAAAMALKAICDPRPFLVVHR
jgi:hypothetical protein